MAVTMTERAAKHVAGFIQRRGKGVGLRVGVRTTGCSGMAYTELDFVREGLNEGFQFNNPREKDRCGCGESFRV
jgi:iron-sulfur cluster assembly protein